jgi:hypothetical protein
MPAEFLDSGAIMVGAAASGIAAAVPRGSRAGATNFGSRIDCYAWGEDVVTTGDGVYGTGTADYSLLPGAFGGTSAAGAIIAGAAACAQGIRKNLGQSLSPATMRALLSDPQFSTAASSAAERIGRMPDLLQIANRLLNPIALPY